MSYHSLSMEFVSLIFRNPRMKNFVIECNFLQNQPVLPDMHDFRSGIMGSLQKLYGEIGAARFVWRIEPESFQRRGNTVGFRVDLENTRDTTERKRFAAGLSSTRVIANERVVLRIVEET